VGSPVAGPSLADSLRASFGHEEFRPGQEEVVRRALRSENLFVVMPTGAGKSLCYQFPALMKTGVAVVVSPVIALMKDQGDALLDRQVKGATRIQTR
jgi:ATP-dependent DNA helicase RecQ